MTEPRDFMLAMADALIAQHLPWMLTGSFATNLYAIPRFTVDADFVVQLESNSISAIAEHIGVDFALDPQMSFETTTSTMRHIFRHRSEQFSIELFELNTDTYDQERFRRRVRIDHHGRSIFIPTAEDVIVQKLRWSAIARREKDILDAKNVMEEQSARLEWDYIKRWCGEHGTLPLLERIQTELRDLT